MGYYEGVNRLLSNKGIVQVRGVDCPVIGNVSMNMTTIDVSHVPQAEVGEEVIVFNSEVSRNNSIQNVAKLINTSPYELLVKLSESTYRKITP